MKKFIPVAALSGFLFVIGFISISVRNNNIAFAAPPCSSCQKTADSGKKQSTSKKICSAITGILKNEIGKTKNRTKLDILKGGLDYANDVCDSGGSPDLAKITKGLPEKDKARISQKTNAALFDGAADRPDKDFGPNTSKTAATEVYEAYVVVQSLRGRKKISINDWFTGPRKTVLAPDELVVEIELPLFKTAHGGCYAKLSRYEGEDLAQSGLAVLVFADNTYKIAFCALGPKPARALKTEGLLNGKKLSDKLISEAAAGLLKEISPIADIRSSKEYRVHMTGVMLERALKAAAAKCRLELKPVAVILNDKELVRLLTHLGLPTEFPRFRPAARASLYEHACGPPDNGCQQQGIGWRGEGRVIRSSLPSTLI